MGRAQKGRGAVARAVARPHLAERQRVELGEAADEARQLKREIKAAQAAD